MQLVGHNHIALYHRQHRYVIYRIKRRRRDGLQERDVGDQVCKSYLSAFNHGLIVFLLGSCCHLLLREDSQHVKEGEEYLPERVVVLAFSDEHQGNWDVSLLFIELSVDTDTHGGFVT